MKRLKEIAKALKVALFSLFNMDYQIEEEEDLSKLKVATFKLAFVVLTITTILWIIVFYTLPQYCLIMGIPLLGGWLGFIVVAIGKLSERKKPTLTVLEACSPPSPN
jgi:hypothetical protein